MCVRLAPPRRQPDVGGLLVGDRQVDREVRPLPHRGLDDDVAPRLLNDAVHGGESQARASARLLGREERFEDARAGLAVHAGALVHDRQHGVLAAARLGMLREVAIVEQLGARGHAQRAPVRHGVASVGHQVDDDPFQLDRIHRHARRGGIAGERQHDGPGRQPPQERLQVSQDDR